MNEPLDPTAQGPAPAQRDTSPASQPLAGAEGIQSAELKRTWWRHVNVRKIALFVISLYLFILAITLMKDGARGLAPLVHDLFSVNSPANTWTKAGPVNRTPTRSARISPSHICQWAMC